MTSLLHFIALSAALLSTAVTAAPSATISADHVTSYTFRGVRLAGASVQPTVNLQQGSIYATVWANQPYNRDEAREVDYTLGAAGSSGLDGGITAYTYAQGGTTTYEPYLGYSRDVLSAKVSAYAFHDTTLRITTFEAKGALKLATSERLEASLEGVLGTSHGRYLPSYAYWSIGPVLRAKLGGRLSSTVSMQYVSSSDVLVQRDLAVGRAGLSFAF